MLQDSWGKYPMDTTSYAGYTMSVILERYQEMMLQWTISKMVLK